MGKIPYLVRDKRGFKLRRVVPADIRSAVGKREWVKRISTSSLAEIRKLSNQFAFETENVIEASRAGSVVSEPGFKPEVQTLLKPLAEADAKQLAQDYLDQRLSADFFSQGADLERYDETLSDLEEDVTRSSQLVAGFEINQDAMRFSEILPTVMRLLCDAGYLAEASEIQPSQRGSHLPFDLLRNRVVMHLCHLIERAELEAAKRSLVRLRDGRVGITFDQLFPEHIARDVISQTAVSKNVTLAALITEFSKERVEEVDDKTARGYEGTYRLLKEELGPQKFLSGVTRHDAAEIVKLLPAIPPHSTKRFPKLTFRQAAEWALSDDYLQKYGPFQPRTDEAQKRLNEMFQIFNFALARDWVAFNPFDRVKVSRRKRNTSNDEGTYVPFEISELQMLFNSKAFLAKRPVKNGRLLSLDAAKDAHGYWAPLISLYSGLRSNEILQLEKKDIVELDGIWCFDINDDAGSDDFLSGKRLKTANARRHVPIHPELFKLGLLKWVEQSSEGRIFPSIQETKSKPLSTVYSRQFQSLTKAVGIYVPHRKVFHSLRNNFNDALREAGMPEDMREQCNGWSNQRRSQDRGYGKGYRVKTMHEKINEAKYDGLDLAHLYLDF